MKAKKVKLTELLMIPLIHRTAKLNFYPKGDVIDHWWLIEISTKKSFVPNAVKVINESHIQSSRIQGGSLDFTAVCFALWVNVMRCIHETCVLLWTSMLRWFMSWCFCESYFSELCCAEMVCVVFLVFRTKLKEIDYIVNTDFFSYSTSKLFWYCSCWDGLNVMEEVWTIWTIVTCRAASAETDWEDVWCEWVFSVRLNRLIFDFCLCKGIIQS